MADEALWRFTAAHRTDEDRRLAVEILERDQMVEIFVALLDLRADLVDELVTSGRAAGATEDTLDDLAESIVAEGEARYRDVMDGGALPPSETWENPRRLLGIIARAFDRRFGEEILDAVEAAGPSR